MDPEFVVDGGMHAISWIQKSYANEHKTNFNYGKDWKGKCYSPVAFDLMNEIEFFSCVSARSLLP